MMTTCAPTLKRLALYTGFVGASLLAKAIVQTPCFLCLHWPIREQARTGPMCCGGGTPAYLMTTCAPTLKRLALYANLVGASLLAKAIVQTPCFLCLHWPIREQVGSHRTDVLRGRHAAVVDDDMRAHAEALGVVHRSCGSNKHKAWGRDLGIFKRTAS
ncbi:hypothetical protein BKM30_21720 [Pseudomonas syringae pv. syringae]|nr:hypothetical protein BKM27_20550 [Pseudomonas syringae pv. syringae]POR75564.1 hypothetical protein BKM30_21720 [Pseudomonas syringae pv. syringae]